MGKGKKGKDIPEVSIMPSKYIMSALNDTRVFTPTLLKLPETLGTGEFREHIVGVTEEINSIRSDLTMWKSIHGSYMQLLDKNINFQKEIVEKDVEIARMRDDLKEEGISFKLYTESCHEEAKGAIHERNRMKGLLELSIEREKNLKDENNELREKIMVMSGRDRDMDKSKNDVIKMKNMTKRLVEFEKRMQKLDKDNNEMSMNMHEKDKSLKEYEKTLKVLKIKEDMLKTYTKELIVVANDSLYKVALYDNHAKKMDRFNASLVDFIRDITLESQELLGLMEMSYERAMRFGKLYIGILQSTYGKDIMMDKKFPMATEENVIDWVKNVENSDFYHGMKEHMDNGYYKNIGKPEKIDGYFLTSNSFLTYSETCKEISTEVDESEDMQFSRIMKVGKICKNFVDKLIDEDEMSEVFKVLGDVKIGVHNIRDITTSIITSCSYLSLISTDPSALHERLMESIAYNIITISHPNDAKDMIQGLMQYEVHNGKKVTKYIAYQLGIRMDVLMKDGTIKETEGWCPLMITSWRKIATLMNCMERYHGRSGTKVIVKGKTFQKNRIIHNDLVSIPECFIRDCASYDSMKHGDKIPVCETGGIVHKVAILEPLKEKCIIPRQNTGYINSMM